MHLIVYSLNGKKSIFTILQLCKLIVFIYIYLYAPMLTEWHSDSVSLVCAECCGPLAPPKGHLKQHLGRRSH